MWKSGICGRAIGGKSSAILPVAGKCAQVGRILEKKSHPAKEIGCRMEV